MTFTLSQAFGRAFMGQAPPWYKLAVVAFLVANPVLLLLAGPLVTGWALLAEFIFTLAMALRTCSAWLTRVSRWLVNSLSRSRMRTSLSL